MEIDNVATKKLKNEARKYTIWEPKTKSQIVIGTLGKSP